MHQKVKSYIAQHKLFDKSDQLALAISGGKDSVFAAHILNDMKVPFVMVHVNFQLRGQESNDDQQFVSELSAKLTYCKALYVKKADTKTYKKNARISTQEAARQIRYDFFEELYEEKVFTKLITAHHGSDNVETFFINLYRTSGLRGLSGIPTERSYIVRPFLALPGNEILDYVKKHGLNFREDSSNNDTTYLRNTFRHKVLPQIAEELPDFEERAQKSMSYLFQEVQIFDRMVNGLAEKWVERDEAHNRKKISKATLLSYPQSHVILYYILDKYGFNRDQCKQIVQACEGESGKSFRTSKTEVVVDRDYVLVSKTTTAKHTSYELAYSDIGSITESPIKLKHTDIRVFPKSNFEELVHIPKQLFPLTVRTWQEGDRIQPLGMNGSKLLSDFFIDEKVDVQIKKSLMLLCKGDEVLWVPGHRISEKVKVSGDQSLFKISYAAQI